MAEQFKRPLAAINVGLESFYESLISQGAQALQVELVEQREAVVAGVRRPRAGRGRLAPQAREVEDLQAVGGLLAADEDVVLVDLQVAPDLQGGRRLPLHHGRHLARRRLPQLGHAARAGGLVRPYRTHP